MSICDTPFISALLTPLDYDERKDGQLVGWLVDQWMMHRKLWWAESPLSQIHKIAPCPLLGWDHLITAVDGEGEVWSMLREAASFQVGGWQRACDPACKTPLQYSSHQRTLLRCSSPSYWISVCHIGLFLFSSFSELVLVTRARTPFVWIWIPDKAPTGCRS